MINLGKLILPPLIFLDLDEEDITLRIPEFMSQDYIDLSQCSLQLSFSNSIIYIDYYSEDDFFLSERLEIDYIAKGDLKEETFEAIQERALKELCEFIDDAQQEMLEHFNEL